MSKENELVHGPAGVQIAPEIEEVIVFPLPTLESHVLSRADTSSISEIRGYGKIIVKDAILADVVAADLQIEERNALMIYRVWARENEITDGLVKFSGFSRVEIQKIIDSFLWQTKYDQYYDRADEIESLIGAGQKIDTYRVVIEEINILLSEGADRSQIKSSMKEILLIESRKKAKIRVEQLSLPSKLSKAGLSEEQIKLCGLIAKYKKAGFGNSEIAERLEIGIAEVNSFSRTMIALGLVKPHVNGAAHSKRFSLLADQVAQEESSVDDEPLPTESELAVKLGVSGTTIKRARALNSVRGLSPKRPRRFSKKPGYEIHKNWRSLVKKGVLAGLTNEEISYEHGISKNAVKYHRANLIDDGELQPSRSAKGENKKRLIEILEAHLVTYPGEAINLSQLLRSGVFRVSYSTLQSMYSEIAREREVPLVGKTKGEEEPLRLKL